MRAVADTHAAIWYLWAPENLSARAVGMIDDAARDGEQVGVSAITLCEIVYLAEKGRIRPDAPRLFAETLTESDSPFAAVPVDVEIAARLPSIPRATVPDMPDRIIAATALFLGVPLITRDRALLNSAIPTVW